MPITLTRPIQPVIVAAACLFLLASGCSSNREARTDLSAVDQSLQQKRYDEAIAQADAFLARQPTGAGAAEALYLRGLAFEQKIAANPHESRQNFQSARASYIEALNRRPHNELETRIRTALANVAYFQNDYQTALTQWAAALPRIEHPETRAWTLYRMGLCQQRLGQFQQADQTFAAVQKEHPGTEPARRAKEHAGARSFFVQLVTFKSAASADKVTAALRREGLEPVRVPNAQGFQQIRVGPVPSYAQAMSLKTRFADRYPDAIIIP
ncbi:MAG TPA: tetratricopeptide repeat protein [Tepidisphaeraceae bacterium]|nr:tetratricopeptide repeat protein [Tepidisphaeraceae bacterium]